MRDWLSHRVVSSPDDTALIRAEDGEAWTYTDLDQLVSDIAGRLVAHGVEAGDRLGVLTPPYVGTVGLVHASMRIGATFVPLAEEFTGRELAQRVEGADLDAIVCADPTENVALGAVEECESVDAVPVLSVDEPIAEEVTAVHGVDPEPVEPARWEESDYLCVLFTSGTTGDPKPVPLTAGNVYSSAVASAFRLGVEPEDRWLVSLSLHHMGGLAPVYRSALYGTTLVLREGFAPGGTADDIDSYDVTGISLVPTMLKRMLDRRGTLADSLRVVLLGGAPASEELLERCHDYSVPVYPTYGMTEAASQIATATPRQTRDRLTTVGRPLFGIDVTIVDEDGTPAESGATGEIVVDGPTVTPGYVETSSDDADGDTLDRSAFGPHGLHTGDVGKIDDEGFLSVLNRLDDRIVTGGENVEPGEVIEVLRTFPSVEDAAVVGLDDEVWGERVSALLAVGDVDGVEPKGVAGSTDNESGETDADGAETTDESETTDEGETDADGVETSDESETGDDEGETDADGAETGDETPGDAEEADEPAPPVVDEAELLSFARERLAGFKIPKTVGYVDSLPRTVSGTVDRSAVRRLLCEHGHDPRNGDADLETAGFEPADPADPDDQGDVAESVDGDEPGPAEDVGIDEAEPARDATREEAEAAEGDDSEETDSAEGAAADEGEVDGEAAAYIEDAEPQGDQTDG